MIINKVNEVFWEHIHRYDATDPAILKKIIHSFTVANTSYEIGCSLNFNEKERIFCYIMGLYHDIGRFEQWKLYGTFDDNKCVSHGTIGVEMFKKYIDPTLFELNKEETELLLDTIKYHIEIYKGNDEILFKYLKIIHSADAYANLINFSLGNQNLDGLEDGYSDEILNKFYNNEPLFNVSVYTKLERLLKSLSATSCIKFPLLRKEVIDKNYIEIFYDTYEKVLNSEDRIVYRKAVDYLKNHYI